MAHQFALTPVRTARPTLGFTVSLLVHAAFALPLVLPQPEVTETEDRIEQLVVFLVPPDVEGQRAEVGRGLDWAGVVGEQGQIEEPPPPPAEPVEPLFTEGIAGDPTPVDPEPLGDPEPVETALTEIEVDSMVQRDPTSASPIYPPEMLDQKISGSTFVNYVVDTTGRVDTNTIKVIRTTHEAFAVSVREALAKMRFRPAIQGSRKVRQWVEQSFAFKIVPPGAPDTTGAGRRT
ncbi:MAG: TonB family protein [Gemmatimonadales bacterium]